MGPLGGNRIVRLWCSPFDAMRHSTYIHPAQKLRTGCHMPFVFGNNLVERVFAVVMVSVSVLVLPRCGKHKDYGSSVVCYSVTLHCLSQNVAVKSFGRSMERIKNEWYVRCFFHQVSYILCACALHCNITTISEIRTCERFFFIAASWFLTPFSANPSDCIHSGRHAPAESENGLCWVYTSFQYTFADTHLRPPRPVYSRTNRMSEHKELYVKISLLHITSHCASC